MLNTLKRLLLFLKKKKILFPSKYHNFSSSSAPRQPVGPPINWHIDVISVRLQIRAYNFFGYHHFHHLEQNVHFFTFACSYIAMSSIQFSQPPWPAVGQASAIFILHRNINIVILSHPLSHPLALHTNTLRQFSFMQFCYCLVYSIAQCKVQCKCAVQVCSALHCSVGPRTPITHRPTSPFLCPGQPVTLHDTPQLDPHSQASRRI